MRNDYLITLSRLRQQVDWLPGPVFSVLLLVLAVGLALLADRLIMDAILRLPGQRRGAFVRNFMREIRPTARIMLVIIVVGATIPATSFTYATTSLVAKGLAVLMILAIGNGIRVALHVFTDAYLGRIAARNATDDIAIRSHQTQVRVLRRMLEILAGLVTVGVALMTFDSVRQYGVSLFASAGAASLVVGLSARPLLTNLLAGIQIAITQPIRIEDLVIINGDWCWVEEITSTYVVLRVWDLRRHIVPISFFLENQFENWTHNSAALIGTVFLQLDYAAPMSRIRAMLDEVIETCPLWDREVLACQVADSDGITKKIRIIAGASGALQSWDLRCDIREKMLDRIIAECPEALPRNRQAIVPSLPGGAVWPDRDTLSPPIPRPPSASGASGAAASGIGMSG
ncbi:mechanosensitive ion channel family protein [Rhizosaccharibacter radicis]|uniref:Mechanosensitive ion channel family protein n=1 Tax=Rhizosaccharibacter radicis TaxID=2782605 RepID=A0ABT1VSU0_9PROT|nr:mechanosensitive ion channel family protein [Acetobacteraceae bacterium KSS12]